MSDLKPCPFCGKTDGPQAEQFKPGGLWRVVCDCGCQTTSNFTAETYAVKQWNTRSGDAPSAPDGWILVPRELTAENGAKAALIGEFSEEITTLDEDGDEQRVNVPVSWDTIKSIHRIMVRLFDTQRALSQAVSPVRSAASTAEPVAWEFEAWSGYVNTPTEWVKNLSLEKPFEAPYRRNIRPLYAAPTTSPEPASSPEFPDNSNCSKSSNGSPEPDAVREALQGLLDHVDRETCSHEETHRGGSIWTICDGCGRKWADDEGGFRAYVDAPEVAAARAALSRPAHGGWERVEISDEDMRDLLSSKDVGSGRAKLRRLLGLKSTTDKASTFDGRMLHEQYDGNGRPRVGGPSDPRNDRGGPDAEA